MTGDHGHHHHQHHHHDHHHGHHHHQQQHHHHGHHHHHHHHHKGEDQPPPPPVPEYGTFQPPFEPVMGYPQPVPSPGAIGYALGYHQAIPGNYVVDERGVVIERPLRCCGLGVGWFLFILGFFLAGGPWYVASFILLCNRSIDRREKPGYVACAIAVGIAVISLIVFLITGY